MLNKIISVRISADEDVKIIDHINRCEGKTFSDRFRAFLSQAVQRDAE